MTSVIEDINVENAQALLIEESFKRPVLVDFWADWCGPCKSLMPILESLAAEYDGQFLLAKVNADEQAMIASQFGVRSLPTVMLIKNGQPVDGFTGAQSEVQVRELLEKHLPKPWDIEFAKALEILSLADGDQSTGTPGPGIDSPEPGINSPEVNIESLESNADESHEQKAQRRRDALNEALPILQKAYDDSSKQANITLVLAKTLIESKRFEQAGQVLADVKMADQSVEFEQLKASLELAQEAKKAPEIEALEKRLAQDPSDIALAYQLALQYSQHEYASEALELLLNLLRRDMNSHDGEVKKAYLDILASLGKGDPIAIGFQRKLFALLY